MPNTKPRLTHFDARGKARMVDVSAKAASTRVAVARGRIVMSPATVRLIASGTAKKGDVLSVAQLAGIMGAKQTPALIPLCHPIALSSVKLTLSLDRKKNAVEIEATCKTV